MNMDRDMNSPTNEDAAAHSFTFDAHEVQLSPAFRTSPGTPAHETFTEALWPVLADFARAFGGQAPEGEQQGGDRLMARAALDDALTAEVICCIAEALERVGVADPATIFEACRVVLNGGQMWDGHGFLPGQVPASISPSPAVRPVHCPRCGRWLAECWGQWRGVLRVRCRQCKRSVYYLAAEGRALSRD